MGSSGKKFVLILNIEKLLSSDELLNAAHAAAAGREAASTTQPAASNLDTQ